MANYKPVAKYILASNAYDGTIVAANLSTVPWSMLILLGTAKHNTSILPSGGVLVWENHTTASGFTPNHQTFGDVHGRYGVTVRSDVNLIIKYYGR